MRSRLIKATAPLYAMRGWVFRLLGRRARSHAESHVRRVVVLRLDELGDVLLTGPLLRELRSGLPAAHVTLVVSPAARALVEHCPYVDEVLTYPRGAHPRWHVLGGLTRARRYARRHLRPREFDLAIVPRRDADTYHATFLAYWSGAGTRVGFSEESGASKAVRNRGYDHLLTDVVAAGAPRHEVESNLQVLERVGVDAVPGDLEAWLAPEDLDAADRLLASHGIGEADVVVALGIGARSRRRIWPAERFAEVAMWLRTRYAARIVLVGGPGEEPLGARVAAALDGSAVDLVGRLGLRESAAVLRRCDLLVGNDSGAMHLAAATGTPIVEISCHPVMAPDSHPNSPHRFGPWGVSSKVLRPEPAGRGCADGCRARRAHCILGVGVEQVCDAAASRLERGRSAAGPL